MKIYLFAFVLLAFSASLFAAEDIVRVSNGTQKSDSHEKSKKKSNHAKQKKKAAIKKAAESNVDSSAATDGIKESGEATSTFIK